jgi:hypothetical protein
MERNHVTRLLGFIGIAGAVTILLGFPIQKVEPATPTIKVPGPYPYEESVRIPAPDIVESTIVPTPAPFPYPDSLSPVPVRDSQIAHARRPLSAKSAREAAFKYNGVASFFRFLAALPADVSVFDAKLGRTRELVKGGHVIDKNVAWLRKRRQAPPKPNDRTLLSVEELGMRDSGT